VPVNACAMRAGPAVTAKFGGASVTRNEKAALVLAIKNAYHESKTVSEIMMEPAYAWKVGWGTPAIK
jgi:hypothetical protein